MQSDADRWNAVSCAIYTRQSSSSDDVPPGAMLDRPALQRLLALIRQHGINQICVHLLDWFERRASGYVRLGSLRFVDPVERELRYDPAMCDGSAPGIDYRQDVHLIEIEGETWAQSDDFYRSYLAVVDVPEWRGLNPLAN